MTTKDINLIVAASENNAIGWKGQMPWHLPADLKYFKTVTMGHDVIMGRKTFEAIGRPLPGRRNLVVSRQPNLKIEGCEVFASIEEAVDAAQPGAFVIGGAQIYHKAWEFVSRIYLTRVHIYIYEFDAAIPSVDKQIWNLVESSFYAADEKHAYDMTFEVYERNKAGETNEDRLGK